MISRPQVIDKTFTVQLFNPTTGQSVTVNNAMKGGRISWTWRTNSAQSPLELDLSVPYNSIDPMYEIGNTLKIKRITKDDPKGKLIYTGYLVERCPYIEPNQEGIRLLFGGAGYPMTWCTTDSGVSPGGPGAIFKDIIARANAEGLPFPYDDSMVQEPPVYGVIRFEYRTLWDDLKEASKFLPADWFWRLEPSGKFVLEQYNDDPYSVDHLLHLKRSVKDVKICKSSSNLANRIILKWTERVTYFDQVPAGNVDGLPTWDPSSQPYPCPTTSGDRWYVSADGSIGPDSYDEGEIIRANFTKPCPTSSSDFTTLPIQYVTQQRTEDEPRVTIVEDPSSISELGKRERIIQAGILYDTEQAQAQAEAYLDKFNQYRYEGTVTVNSVYNIECIYPGHTCRIQNVDKTNDVYPEVFRITSISYREDFVSLTLEEEVDLIGELRQAIS